MNLQRRVTHKTTTSPSKHSTFESGTKSMLLIIPFHQSLEWVLKSKTKPNLHTPKQTLNSNKISRYSNPQILLLKNKISTDLVGSSTLHNQKQAYKNTKPLQYFYLEETKETPIFRYKTKTLPPPIFTIEISPSFPFPSIELSCTTLNTNQKLNLSNRNTKILVAE